MTNVYESLYCFTRLGLLQLVRQNLYISKLKPNGFNAKDPEDGTNIKYSILSSTYSSYFSLSLTGLSLTVVQRLDLDRVQANSFPLDILAQDNGSPPLQAKATILLTISATIDNSPIFNPTSYVGNVNG